MHLAENESAAVVASQPEEQSSGPVSRLAAQAMGFSAEELEALTDAGVLVAEGRVGPWQPTTLQDVDWIGNKRRQIAQEIADRTRVHQLALQRLGRALQAFDRFEEPCREIVIAALPRNSKGGFRAKSIPLETCVVRIRSTGERLAVGDEAAVLEFLTEQRKNPDVASLLNALRVTVTETIEGADGLTMLGLDGPNVKVAAKVLHRPLIAALEAWPDDVDEETGAVTSGPKVIPGVSQLPATDTLEWD